MKFSVRRLLIAGVAVFSLIIGSLAGMAYLSQDAPVLGVVDGQLSDCPDSPNCVNSLSNNELHSIAPFASTEENTAELLDTITGLIEQMPRTSLIDQSPGYRRFEFRSPVLRFVDDVELLADPDQGVVHVRSASRSGHSDLGANRDRVEAIRQALDAKQD